MAILWQARIDGRRYEVRTAGNTRRLYTNGVAHSQYNPLHPVTGSVWDLLLIPAFFYPQGAVRRVLVLGVGGGAVIRQLLHFVRPEEIVGVELNPVHLYIARRFFGLDQENVQLCEADAVKWMKSYQGPPFDLIIDDVFGDAEGEPMRAVSANTRWFYALLNHLAKEGALVSNFLSSRRLHSSAYFSDPKVKRLFKAAFELLHPRTENAVGVFLRRDVGSQTLRARLKGVPQLNPSLKRPRLRYRIRRI